MKRVSIGSDIGLSPIRPQAIILTSAGLLSIGPLGTNFSENQNTKVFIHRNASENIVCETAAILSRGRWVNVSITGDVHIRGPNLVVTVPADFLVPIGAMTSTVVICGLSFYTFLFYVFALLIVNLLYFEFIFVDKVTSSIMYLDVWCIQCTNSLRVSIMNHSNWTSVSIFIHVSSTSDHTEVLL